MGLFLWHEHWVTPAVDAVADTAEAAALLALCQAFQAASEAARAAGYTHAAAMMDHYISGSGMDVHLPKSFVMQSENARHARDVAKNMAWEQIKNSVTAYTKVGDKFDGVGKGKKRVKDDWDVWYAMGQFDVDVAAEAVVTAKFVNNTTVQHEVALTYKFTIEDKYDWHPEKGWGVDIGPIFLPDSVPDSLRKVGARTFWMRAKWTEKETRTLISTIELEDAEICGSEDKSGEESRNSGRREGEARRDSRRRGGG